MTRMKILIIFIVLFVTGVTAIIFYYESVLNNGVEVILETIPRDPRDIIRGDYVVLRYKIGSGDQVRKILKNKNFQKGQTVYSILETNKNQKVVVKDVVEQEPKTEVLYIKGVVSERWSDNQIIKYENIEQYFVPEGKGRSIERMSDLEVLVSIKNGNALIKSLLKDGQVIDFKDIEKRKNHFIF